MKRTQTLIDECEALTRKACALVDELERVRAERDAKLAEIHARPDGRTYDRGYA